MSNVISVHKCVTGCTYEFPFSLLVEHQECSTLHYTHSHVYSQQFALTKK